MKFLNSILFGVADRKRLALVKDLSVDSNLNFLKGASFTCVILLLLPLLEIIFFTELSNRFLLYSSFFGIAFFVFLLAFFVVKKHLDFVLPLFYLLFMTCLFYGLYLGIFASPEHPGATFHILVFVFPLLISDVPWRLDAVIILFCSMYIYASAKIKTPDIFHIEFMNVLNSMVLSMVIATFRQIQNVDGYIDRLVLKKQRDTDVLSRTLSRVALETEIKASLGDSGKGGCLMFVDIDNFKYINDTYGHVVGDDFIIDTGRCLKMVCSIKDIVGRYGGDEFLLFFPDLYDKAVVEDKAKEILLSVQTCGIARQLKESLSVSIGCLIFHSSENLQGLLKQVDEVLYEAKNNGKNRFCLNEI